MEMKNTPDLDRFDGLQPGPVIRTLRQEGFEIIGSGTDSVVLAKPQDDYVIRITNFAGQAEALAALARDNSDSAFFPQIFDTHLSEGNPPVFITVMERLLALDDIPEQVRPTVGGWARALATLIDGHESHDAVHGLMYKTPEIFAAADAIIAAMEDRLAAGEDTFIYYDSGFSDSQGIAIDDWFPENVLFRQLESGGYQPVFADPFREAFTGGAERRAAFAEDLRALRDRAGTLSAPKAARPKETGPSPSRGPSL